MFSNLSMVSKVFGAEQRRKAFSCDHNISMGLAYSLLFFTRFVDCTLILPSCDKLSQDCNAQPFFSLTSVGKVTLSLSNFVAKIQYFVCI